MAAKRATITLCLVRCGETTWREQKRLFGSTDLPLSEPAQAALGDEANVFAVDSQSRTIHHPPDEAATQTAAAYATASSGKARVAPELADPALGLLEGMAEQEFAQRFAKRFKQWQEDPLSLSPPEGEEFDVARERIFNAVARICRRSRADEVVLVLHDLATGFLRCWLADRPASDLWKVLNEGPRIERYEIAPNDLEALEEAADTQATG